MMYNSYPTPSLSSASSSPTSSSFQDHTSTPLTTTFFWTEDCVQYGQDLPNPPVLSSYNSVLPLEHKHPDFFIHQSVYCIWPPLTDPNRLKVYYLPDGKCIPQWSIVHVQKRQDGFFRHPVLVVDVDQRYAHFYAMTRQPPHAIAELGMCLKVGISHVDEGLDTLRLQAGSQHMHHETWINLEQCFKIEKQFLQDWSHNVTIAESGWGKLRWKIEYLEAQQNRFIYKPIARDLSQVQIGTVVLMPNPRGSSTLGAPVVVLENQYPHFRFLRVKSLAENIIFQEPRSEYHTRARRNCLAITPTLQYGHDGTPVMVLEPWSPDLREKSYVEVNRKPKWGRLDKCQTWSWPPVVIQMHSIKVLYDYIARLPPPTTGSRAQTQERKDSEFQPKRNLQPVQPKDCHAKTASTYKGYDHLSMNSMSRDVYSYANTAYDYSNYNAQMAVYFYNSRQPSQINTNSSYESSPEPVGLNS